MTVAKAACPSWKALTEFHAASVVDGPGHISALMHPCKTFAEYRGAVVTGRDDKIAFVIDVAIQGVRVAYKSESVVV